VSRGRDGGESTRRQSQDKDFFDFVVGARFKPQHPVLARTVLAVFPGTRAGMAPQLARTTTSDHRKTFVAAVSDRRNAQPSTPLTREKKGVTRKSRETPSARLSRCPLFQRHRTSQHAVKSCPILSASEKRRRCRCGHPSAAAGKPEAQAEGIRVAAPETTPHSLGSRLGLQGTGPPNRKNLKPVRMKRTGMIRP
jgi:hypothetical protein